MIYQMLKKRTWHIGFSFMLMLLTMIFYIHMQMITQESGGAFYLALTNPSQVLIRRSMNSSDSYQLYGEADGQAIPEASADRETKDYRSTVMPWLNRSDGIHESYLLSAFWDDRYAEVSETFISTLAFMRHLKSLPEDGQIYCFVSCNEPSGASLHVHAANMTEIRERTKGRGKEFDGEQYLRLVIPCPPGDCPRPDRVSIGYRNDSLERLDHSNSVPVEYPAKEPIHEFGICVPPIFGCLDPHQVVEWMEINRILGVSKVIIHNNSQCEPTSRVFEAYAAEGLVELRQDRTVLPCDENKTFGGWRMPMSRAELFLRDPLMLTDCMYRHMHNVKHIFFIDLDEVLVPERKRTLHELVEQLDSIHSLSDEHLPFNQLTFRSYFFLLDDLLVSKPADETRPRFTSFLRHRNRLGPSPDNRRRKSIVSAAGCELVNNHVCPAPINELKPEAPAQRQLYVSENTAKIHHYRREACSRRGNNEIRCQGDVSPDVVYQDDAMLRYEDQLIRNTKQRLMKLGMSIDGDGW